MKIFLDDERDPVYPFDFIARDYDSFTWFVSENRNITFISFDHDLGDCENGYDCVKWLVQFDIDNHFKILSEEFTFYVHSQNPVGKKNIESYLSQYLKVRAGLKNDKASDC